MNEKVVAWSIPITLASIVAGAYLLAWRGRRLPIRRGASWVLATVSALAGDGGGGWDAVPPVEEPSGAAVAVCTAVIWQVIAGGVWLGAMVVAGRFPAL